MSAISNSSCVKNLLKRQRNVAVLPSYCNEMKVFANIASKIDWEKLSKVNLNVNVTPEEFVNCEELKSIESRSTEYLAAF